MHFRRRTVFLGDSSPHVPPRSFHRCESESACSGGSLLEMALNTAGRDQESKAPMTPSPVTACTAALLCLSHMTACAAQARIDTLLARPPAEAARNAFAPCRADSECGAYSKCATWECLDGAHSGCIVPCTRNQSVLECPDGFRCETQVDHLPPACVQSRPDGTVKAVNTLAGRQARAVMIVAGALGSELGRQGPVEWLNESEFLIIDRDAVMEVEVYDRHGRSDSKPIATAIVDCKEWKVRYLVPRPSGVRDWSRICLRLANDEKAC